MENAERDELSRWIRESTALLAPPDGWEPNSRAAMGRLKFRPQRQSAAPRALSIGVTVVAIVCILAVAVPLTQVSARDAGIGWPRVAQFWYWITIGYNQQLVRLGRLPDCVKSIGLNAVTSPGSPQQVTDVAEASRRAGFMPQMPDSGVMPASPRLSVLGAASFGAAFRAAELESALRQAHVTDQTVPAAWDGAWVGVQVPARVIADWSDVPDPGTGTVRWSRMTLAQSTPPAFELPSGIDLTSFVALNLRTTLMSADSARRLAQDAIPAAALLVGEGTSKSVGVKAAVAVRYVSLRHGPAVLIEQWDDLSQNQSGQETVPIERLVLVWSVPDRVYVLTGDLNAPVSMTSYDLAGAVATVVGVADRIR